MCLFACAAQMFRACSDIRFTTKDVARTHTHTNTHQLFFTMSININIMLLDTMIAERDHSRCTSADSSRASTRPFAQPSCQSSCRHTYIHTHTLFLHTLHRIALNGCVRGAHHLQLISFDPLYAVCSVCWCNKSTAHG